MKESEDPIHHLIMALREACKDPEAAETELMEQVQPCVVFDDETLVAATYGMILMGIKRLKVMEPEERKAYSEQLHRMLLTAMRNPNEEED